MEKQLPQLGWHKICILSFGCCSFLTWPFIQHTKKKVLSDQPMFHSFEFCSYFNLQNKLCFSLLECAGFFTWSGRLPSPFSQAFRQGFFTFDQEQWEKNIRMNFTESFICPRLYRKHLKYYKKPKPSEENWRGSAHEWQNRFSFWWQTKKIN